MPHITARDGTRLYYEEAGSGTPVVFVHEYAGDYRTWEPQMRLFLARRIAASPTASAAIRPPTCRTTARATARTSRATTSSR